MDTFRFVNDYEYEIWLKVFSRILKKIDFPESFILPYFTRKISTVIFREGGYALSRSKNDKTSNIW